VTPERQLELLRAHEPVIRFTRGELFVPIAVDGYVAGSALVRSVGGRDEVLAERGTLDLERLAVLGREHAEDAVSMRHVDRPLRRAEYRAWRRRPDRERFRGTNRFAVVGLMARLVDVLFRLTLLVRGTVPGGFTAAAHQACARITPTDHCTYYGRVTTDAGYVVLQYWYFYAMNDWRSSFTGVNDHEADWEQVTIFLVPDDTDPVPDPGSVPDTGSVGGPDATEGPLRPAWVAFSSHDEVGADLRRRWDDPDITFVDGHPVVHAGAGSHSGAYLPGDYVVTAALPLPEWVASLRRGWARIRPWRRGEAPELLGIPYIDHRRGDGLSVGAGGDREWQPVLIDDDTPWVREFRGLWGLDTADPFGGERAPAGPRYERNRTIRASWGQPVAWAGLDREPSTEAESRARAAEIVEVLQGDLAAIEEQLEARRDRLRGARATERALGRPPRTPGPDVVRMEAEVAALRARQREFLGLLDGAELARAHETRADPPHAHLSHRAVPLGDELRSTGRLVRIWSAASATVLVAAVGVLLLGDGIDLDAGLRIAGVMIVIESVVRRRVGGLLLGAVLLAGGWRWARAAVSTATDNLADWIGIGLILLALYLAFQTLREAVRTR
jgi:hypothetical protein